MTFTKERFETILNKFNIKDKVYHITKESPEGVVLDIRYYFITDTYEYLVTWGYNDSSYSWEEELCYNKVF